MKLLVPIIVVLVAVGQSLFADDASVPKLTHANVSYGPHAVNVLDFWKADGEGPRPLLVYIHGGGWTGGDKKQATSRFQPYLAKGISYAAINYGSVTDGVENGRRRWDQRMLPQPFCAVWPVPIRFFDNNGFNIRDIAEGRD